jgi:NAD(P)-dependent dehydrogenase (short-subunit alcohol dehydrogenase family)
MSKVALITGGAGGIGFAIARRLAADGARVALADIHADALEHSARTLRELGHEVLARAGDVSDPLAVRALVQGVIDRYGQLDMLVNNAGIMGRIAPLWELADEDWHRVIETNLNSVFLMSREALIHMRARGSGCIVSVASIAGKEGTPQLIPYSVTKAGIIAFTKALGKELALEGIRVNCVAPGVVQTSLLDQLTPQAVTTMLSKSPMGRFGTADEVASVVQFLLSEDASFLTAQCVDASGGRAVY